MKRNFLFILLFSVTICTAQPDSTKWLRAFPITDYIVDLNDSTKVVQLQMPDGYTLREKQAGVVYGVYKTSKEDAVEKGYGKCHLIKGDYYYFTVSNNKSGLKIATGDLLYTLMDKTAIYEGQIPKIATHFIRLLDVYDQPFFDRYTIFFQWAKPDEEKLIDSMVADIRFTGNYFMENNPSMDELIKSGDYKNKKVLTVMSKCMAADVKDFLSYINARPRLYAGREWKIAEIFATWLTAGAPKPLE